MEPVSAVEASYKARAVESFLDLYFYRKVGYRLALLFGRLRMTPAQVTLCGGLVGISAGHFYFYSDLRWNVLGMALHVLSNALDNADGQLARLTNSGSRTGRALDGVADHLVFVSIYAHLALRHIAEDGSPWIWLLALAAGISHSLQSAAADYFRNAWLYFAKGTARAEIDSSRDLQVEFDRLTWRSKPLKKALLKLQQNYTRQQEWLAPWLSEFLRAAGTSRHDSIARAYQQASRSSLKLLNLLATNPRMILLFALLFLGAPAGYFWAELTLFNLVLIVLLRRQHAVCRSILKLDERKLVPPEGHASA